MKKQGGKNKAKKRTKMLTDKRDIRVLPVKYAVTQLLIYKVMHNNPEKKERYFRDLNKELDAENRKYEDRILLLKNQCHDEKSNKVKYQKALDKMIKIKGKVKQGIEKEEKRKKVRKVKKDVHKNLESFITNKIQKNEKIKKFKQKQKMDLENSRIEIFEERKKKYNQIKSLKDKAREDLVKKITEDITQKRKNKEEKKRIMEVNRKVKQQLVSFQQKMSKRSALMKRLVKLKHHVEKTTPYYVAANSNIERDNPEDEIISEFIINNKEIKKMTSRLKSMRTMRKPSIYSHMTKKKILKEQYRQLMKSSRSIANWTQNPSYGGGTPRRALTPNRMLSSRNQNHSMLPPSRARYHRGSIDAQYNNQKLNYSQMVPGNRNANGFQGYEKMHASYYQNNFNPGYGEEQFQGALNRFSLSKANHNNTLPTKSRTVRGFHPLTGSTDSNWIFDASELQNEAFRQNSIDKAERYGFNVDGMNSGGSDSIHENFARLKQKNRQHTEKMAISIPSNYAKQDIINRVKMSMSPKAGSDDERFLFGVKRGNVSAMSGMMSREDNSNNLLFSINENLARKKNLSTKPRTKKAVEEEIIDEMFTNKRKRGEYGNISNLSAVRRKPPKKIKTRKRRSAFKGINPNQIFAEFKKMKTNQMEKEELQGKIIDNSCQITKKGKEEIEKRVKHDKMSMIYSEIDSANSEDELADTVKPLDFKEIETTNLDKRKLTFGFQMTNNMMKDGSLNMKELQKKFLENSQLQGEIQRGIQENFEESNMNKSDFPKIQAHKKKKKKKTGSMRLIKTGKSRKKKETKKLTNGRKNLKKSKIPKRGLKNGKRINKNLSKKNLAEKKKNHNVSSRQNLDKVISRYGIPLLPRRETKNDKLNSMKNVSQSNLSRLNKKDSKVNLGKKKRNSILMNTTIEAALKKSKGGRKDLKKKGGDLETTLKNKTERRQGKGKKKIKAKNFKGMEKLREQSKFESENDLNEQVKKSKDRSKRKKISIHKIKGLNSDSPLKGKFGIRNLVESETLHSEEGDNIMIKGLINTGNSRLKAMNTEERLGASRDHHERVTAEYYNKANQPKTSRSKKLSKKEKKGKNKNSFIDKELLEELRNEPSSEEEDVMKGIYSKESNIINGINMSLLKKSIQPSHQKDNTVLNLNYSGESEGFIDGNISDEYLSEEETLEENKSMKEYLINGSKIKPENSLKHSSIGQEVRMNRVKKDSRKNKPNEFVKKLKQKRPSKEINPEDISKIMSGLKSQLSLIESNGGLTGLKNQNIDVQKVGQSKEAHNRQNGDSFVYDQKTQLNIKQLLKYAENLKNACGINQDSLSNSTSKETPKKPTPTIKKVSLNKKKLQNKKRNMRQGESSERSTPKQTESERDSSERRNQDKLGRKKRNRPSRQKYAKEEYGIGNKDNRARKQSMKNSKQDFYMPDQNSLHLFEPNLMNDEDFNDIQSNPDNKKLKGGLNQFSQTSKSMKPLKKSNSMLGSQSRFKNGKPKKKERLNKSFRVLRSSPKQDMKPYSTIVEPHSRSMIQADRHNEMSFRNKNFQSNLSSMSNVSKVTDKPTQKVIQPPTNPGRERNFTLGPMDMCTKFYENFNAENQSKSGADNVSQKTFLTESNNTRNSNIFAQRRLEKSKSRKKDLDIVEIKEDVRERQETRDGKEVQTEYGLKRMKDITSLENHLGTGKQSDSGKDSLDHKIKKNIRNSIKEDSMFGEPFVDFLEGNLKAFEVNPNKVFSISNNKPEYKKDNLFKKSKTQKHDPAKESARISFEMTQDQIDKKRAEMRKGNKFEIEADRTLGNKSPSDRSISFEQKARNRFFVEKNKDKNNKKLKKTNSMILEMNKTVKSEYEGENANKSFTGFEEPEFKEKKDKDKNVFMSSVENNLFSRMDKISDSIDFKQDGNDEKVPRSDKKKQEKVNPIIANKSLHSNFKFSSTNPRVGNMFGGNPKVKGNMAYQSTPKNNLQTISSISKQNKTTASIPSNKLYSDFNLDQFNDKNDSIDLMDEDEEDFNLNFDMNQPLSQIKAKAVSGIQMSPNVSGGLKMNSLTKQLDLSNNLSKRVNHPMMINRDIIDNSNHTKKSNTSHGSGRKIYINTFGNPNLTYEGMGNTKPVDVEDNEQTRPKQFTFNHKMVLNSFKNKTPKKV